MPEKSERSLSHLRRVGPQFFVGNDLLDLSPSLASLNRLQFAVTVSLHDSPVAHHGRDK